MNIRTISLSVLAAIFAFGLVGCGEKEVDAKPVDGPMENAGEKMDKAAEKTGDAIENASDKTGEKIEETGEKMQK